MITSINEWKKINENSNKSIILNAINFLADNGIDNFPGGEYNSNPPYITFDSGEQAFEAFELLMNAGFNVQIDPEYDHVINFYATNESSDSNMRQATEIEIEVMDYLNDLREEGVTNMYGAVPYILQDFPNLDQAEAKRILILWMNNFNHEGNYNMVKENQIVNGNIKMHDMVYVNAYGPSTYGFNDYKSDKPFKPVLYNFNDNTKYEVVYVNGNNIGLFDNGNNYVEVNINNVSLDTPFSPGDEPTVMIHTSSSKNEDYDPAIPFEDEDLYHDIDWQDMESKFTQFASTYPEDQYASMRQTFNFLKEEILKYKMLN